MNNIIEFPDRNDREWREAIDVMVRELGSPRPEAEWVIGKIRRLNELIKNNIFEGDSSIGVMTVLLCEIYAETHSG